MFPTIPGPDGRPWSVDCPAAALASAALDNCRTSIPPPPPILPPIAAASVAALKAAPAAAAAAWAAPEVPVWSTFIMCGWGTKRLVVGAWPWFICPDTDAPTAPPGPIGIGDTLAPFPIPAPPTMPPLSGVTWGLIANVSSAINAFEGDALPIPCSFFTPPPC